MKRIILIILFLSTGVSVAFALGIGNSWTDTKSVVLEFEPLPLKTRFVPVSKRNGQIEQTSDGQTITSNTITYEIVYEVDRKGI